MNFYRDESSNAKWDAQRNLSGRTHYVDDDTLRFHKSRILNTYVVDGGLLFALIESCALDMHNTKRGFRFVVFDVFGTVLERAGLDDTYSTSQAAINAMWRYLDGVDAAEHTKMAAARSAERYAAEMADLQDKVTKLQEKAA